MKSKLTLGFAFLYVLSLLMVCNTAIAQTTTTVVDKEQIKIEIQAKEE